VQQVATYLIIGQRGLPRHLYFLVSVLEHMLVRLGTQFIYGYTNLVEHYWLSRKSPFDIFGRFLLALSIATFVHQSLSVGIKGRTSSRAIVKIIVKRKDSLHE
jgi:hypothetical protein